MEIGVLEWDAIGADKRSLISSPVQVKNPEFENTVNQFRESDWNAG